MLYLSYTSTFDAAHKLPGYPGKCAKLHGHTWKVKIDLTGDQDPETGMILDFKQVKELFNHTVGKFDHSYLNDVIPNPTCENITNKLFNEINEEIYRQGIPIMLISITVWENEDACCTMVA